VDFRLILKLLENRFYSTVRRDKASMKSKISVSSMEDMEDGISWLEYLQHEEALK